MEAVQFMTHQIERLSEQLIPKYGLITSYMNHLEQLLEREKRENISMGPDQIFNNFRNILNVIQNEQKRRFEVKKCEKRINEEKRKYWSLLDEFVNEKNAEKSEHVLLFTTFNFPTGIGALISNLALCLARGQLLPKRIYQLFHAEE